MLRLKESFWVRVKVLTVELSFAFRPTSRMLRESTELISDYSSPLCLRVDITESLMKELEKSVLSCGTFYECLNVFAFLTVKLGL